MYSTKGKRKPLKDPEAPKKPASSFIQFCMKERANVQKELLNTDLLLNCNTVTAEVTKELSKRWATLDSETRKVYEEASLKDRKRYEKEKKMYKPSKEFLKKKAEFEGAPKLSSIKSPLPKVTETVTDHFEDYFNFLHINWKKVQQANPGYSINQTQTEVLRLWQGQKPDECVSTTKVPKKDKFKNNGVSKAFKNPLVPKRPLSAFFLYVRDKRAEVCEASPNLSGKEVAMELGKVWSGLGEDDKAPYITEASKRWERFKEDMKSYFKSKKQSAVVVEMNESANIQSFQASALGMNSEEIEVDVKFEEDSS